METWQRFILMVICVQCAFAFVFFVACLKLYRSHNLKLPVAKKIENSDKDEFFRSRSARKWRRIRCWPSVWWRSARSGAHVCDDVLHDVLRFLPTADLGAVASANRRVHELTNRLLGRLCHLADDNTRLTVYSDGRLSIHNEPVPITVLERARFLRFSAVEVDIHPDRDLCQFKQQLFRIRHVWRDQHVEFIVSGEEGNNTRRTDFFLFELFQLGLFRQCGSVGFRLRDYDTVYIEIVFRFRPLFPFWYHSTLMLDREDLEWSELQSVVRWLNVTDGHVGDRTPKCLVLRGISDWHLISSIVNETISMFHNEKYRPNRFYMVIDIKTMEESDQDPFFNLPNEENRRGEVLEGRFGTVKTRAYHYDNRAFIVVRRPTSQPIPETVHLNNVTLTCKAQIN